MMLTKEECLEALRYLPYDGSSKSRKCAETLEQLIEEHFSNPPLKIGEIQKGTPIYDNLGGYNDWLYVIDTDEQCNFIKVVDSDGQMFWVGFEPNRFYRKEVQE